MLITFDITLNNLLYFIDDHATNYYGNVLLSPGTVPPGIPGLNRKRQYFYDENMTYVSIAALADSVLFDGTHPYTNSPGASIITELFATVVQLELENGGTLNNDVALSFYTANLTALGLELANLCLGWYQNDNDQVWSCVDNALTQQLDEQSGLIYVTGKSSHLSNWAVLFGEDDSEKEASDQGSGLIHTSPATLKTGYISAIVVCGVIVIAGIVGIFLFYRHRRIERDNSFQTMSNKSSEMSRTDFKSSSSTTNLVNHNA